MNNLVELDNNYDSLQIITVSSTSILLIVSINASIDFMSNITTNF